MGRIYAGFEDKMIKSLQPAFSLVLLGIISGIIGGSIGSYAIIEFNQQTEEEIIASWYNAENAVHVSTHSLRKHISDSNTGFILVDLRSQQEYENEHILGAVNIPASEDPDTSAYGDVERIVSSFRELKNSNPGKDIVVYCYSMPCMTGRKIGKMLSEHEIYVKHLGIGWNEWRYHWNLWNHEHEWNNTNVMDYIYSGKEPGIAKGSGSKACLIE